MKNKRKAIFIFFLIFLLGNITSSFGKKIENIGFPKIQNLPPRNEHYVKRKSLTQKIKINLGKTDHFLMLVGMAGMGKTQLAKEYAYTYFDYYDIVWWTDANQDLLPQIKELGQRLNVSKGCTMPNPKERMQDKWLEAIYGCYKNNFSQVLFIIDDIKEEELVNPLIHILKNADILLTSRDQSTRGNSMLITCFTREESIGFLEKTLLEASRDSLNELAEILNDYPLALAQAATYLTLFPSLSVAEYIKLYKDKRNELWKEEEQAISHKNEGLTPLATYRHTVASTFTLLLDKIKKESSYAFDLLKLSSFLGSQDIPKTFLKDWMTLYRKIDDFDFHKAFSALIKFSIFEKSKKTQDLYNIHALLQEFIRDSLTKEEKNVYLEELTNLMSSFLPESSHQVWKILAKDPNIEFHLDALLNFTDQYYFQNDEVLNLKIKYLHFVHFFKSDRQKILKTINSLKEDVENSYELSPLERARFLILFANHTTNGSNCDQAILFSENAEKILTNLQTKAAKEELFFLLVNNLMDYYNLTGDLQKGEVVAKKAEILLPDMSDVNYIALYHFIRSTQLLNQGKYKEALKHVDISIEKLPATDFPPYVHSFKKITKAEILTKLGRLDEASKLAEINYKGLKKIYPTMITYKILKAKNILALIYFKQERLEDSYSIIQSIIEGLNTFYQKPYESPLQAFPYIILGEIYEKRKNFIKALEEYKKAEDVYTHIFKTVEVDDISYLYKNLIILGEKMNDDFLSKHYLERLIEHFGLDHTRTIESLQYLDKHKRPVL
ncbi:MAG: hypothetical protein K2P93_00270 [Alphaproteobacteria bacterium]|nr:hypothetical protein [Alphaproteobacteria bacterium]